MGAEDFECRISRQAVKNAGEAFDVAREEALYWHGHSGYTGTIAEKPSFIMIEPDEGETAVDVIERMIRDKSSEYYDKWGPACCVYDKQSDDYIFFGLASS